LLFVYRNQYFIFIKIFLNPKSFIPINEKDVKDLFTNIENKLKSHLDNT